MSGEEVSMDILCPLLLHMPTDAFSFALVQVSLLLAKMHFRFDMDMLDKELDWEAKNHIHVMWWKPPLYIRMMKR